ncbi:MFS drug efflux pump [Myriangium duriaei CBS 260.36]|uniref:MFS drug efflux pump n=1 Tax=Myriangium duriaei CBS 260.36 TaxID=1168546 RepID=A0A9P4J9U3_9PEZI|nr:MFS drug efflux pump [Myriangium duriaei CBS 260.36]
MLFIAMGFLWTGSQIPVYLHGGIIPEIEADIGGSDRYVWLLLAYLIPLASVTPFVGPMADLFGRKTIAMVGVSFMVIASIVNATAQTMNTFIGGMTFFGVGAGILELTSLAVVGESAPSKKRGLYIGCIILTIIPYVPSVLYANLITSVSSWRWIELWCGGWNLVGGIMTFVFYWPPPRSNAEGLSRWQIFKRMDVTGGISSTAGLTLFLMALTWAGNQYSWTSPHVLATLVLGICFLIFWVIWEVFLVHYPMFPRRLGANPRILTTILIITFVSGANFFSVLVFWPSQYFVTYANYADPISIGVGSLPVGFCIIAGSIICSILVTVLKGKVKLLMIISTGIMLAGNGAMAAANLDNIAGVYVAVSVACLGIGAVIVPCQIVSTLICPDDLIATITACTISIRFVGGAIGYAAYYAVLRQRFTHYAYVYIVPETLKMGIANVTEITDIVYAISGNLASKLHTFPGVDTPEKVETLVRAGQIAFSKSYPMVYLVSIAFGAVAFIASFFLPDVDKFMDGHIAVSYAAH